MDFRKTAAARLLGRVWRGVYVSPLAPLQLLEVPPTSLGPGWVKVRSNLAGICGSDLHLIFLDADPRVHPAVLSEGGVVYLGHEVVGVVEEAGPTTRYRHGDRVVMRARQGKIPCVFRAPKPCARCCSLDYNHCERPVPGVVGGGLGEGFFAHEAALFPVPGNLSDDQAVMIEPAAVSLRSVLRCPPAQKERVLVFGAGTIGFLVLQCVRAVQPGCRVILVAQFPYQAEIALHLGADDVWMAHEDLLTRTAEETGGKLVSKSKGRRTMVGGFDKVYECVGTERTLEVALRLTRAGGAVVLVGASLRPMTLDLTPVWHKEVALLGSVSHGHSSWQGARTADFELATRLLGEGRLSVEGFITHRFRLKDYAQAVKAAVEKVRTRSIKVAFEF